MLRNLSIFILIFIIGFLSFAGEAHLKNSVSEKSQSISISCQDEPIANADSEKSSQHVCHFGHISHCFYFVPTVYADSFEKDSFYGISRIFTFENLYIDVSIKPPIS